MIFLLNPHPIPPHTHLNFIYGIFNFIYSILQNVVTVCLAAIKLAILLAWSLWRQRQVDVHSRSDSTELAEAVPI